MLAAWEASPASAVRSVNTPCPSFRNSATPPPSVLTSRSRSPPPCARWRFQSALSSVTALVKRMPVCDGGSSANPGWPPRGTLSSRQRYPASSCQPGAGEAASRQPEPSARPAAKRPEVTESGRGALELQHMPHPSGLCYAEPILQDGISARGPETSRRADERRACWRRRDDRGDGLAAAAQNRADFPARPRLLLQLGPYLRRVRHQGRDDARRRGHIAAAVGMSGTAARIERPLQHPQLLRGHRHLVRRERLQLVDAPLIVERHRVGAR